MTDEIICYSCICNNWTTCFESGYPLERGAHISPIRALMRAPLLQSQLLLTINQCWSPARHGLACACEAGAVTCTLPPLWTGGRESAVDPSSRWSDWIGGKASHSVPQCAVRCCAHSLVQSCSVCMNACVIHRMACRSSDHRPRCALPRCRRPCRTAGEARDGALPGHVAPAAPLKLCPLCTRAPGWDCPKSSAG